MASHSSWQASVPSDGDGIRRFEWGAAEGRGPALFLGVILYNPGNGAGLLVNAVDPEGQAADWGISVGDIMHEVSNPRGENKGAEGRGRWQDGRGPVDSVQGCAAHGCYHITRHFCAPRLTGS